MGLTGTSQWHVDFLYRLFSETILFNYKSLKCQRLSCRPIYGGDNMVRQAQMYFALSTRQKIQIGYKIQKQINACR